NEVEPNDSFMTATAITPGTVYAHHLDTLTGEDDYFSFVISAPTVVSFDITAYRNGIFGNLGLADDAYYEPRIRLFATDGTTQLATNDRRYYRDSGLTYKFITNGTYFVDVSKAASTGDADYFLTYTSAAVGSLTEVEPNNTPAMATPMSYGMTMSGSMSAADIDFYSVTGAAGDMVSAFFFDQANAQGATAAVTVQLLASDRTTVLAASTYNSQ